MTLERVTPLVWTLLWLIIGCQSIGAYVEGGREAALTEALNDTGATNCYRGMANVSTNQYQRLELMRENTLDRDILCDTKTDGGGWIVIQRRTEGDVDFYKSWTAYKNGFGTPPGDFWLGNEAIYELTNEDAYELRIDFNNGTTDLFAVYSSFKLESEVDNYRLRLGSHSGTLGEDSNGYGLSYSNGVQFSTPDRDNDGYAQGRCADIYLGGWWYNSCSKSNLNGQWHGRHFWWHTASSVRYRYYASRTEMKIRLV